MAIKAVLFDLDGTLLPMDQDVFIGAYFKGLAAHMAPFGYEPNELLSVIWKATMAMIKNDGSATNEAVFWQVFCDRYGAAARDNEARFTAFYHNAFQQVKTVCGFDPAAAAIVRGLSERGVRVVLATNPLFPAVATESRIRWAGLEPHDFELVTTYENIGFCKPNPAYYRDILTRLELKPEECLMVGNDVGDDMVAETLGLSVFLLTDNLINKDNVDISRYENGGFDELFAFLNLNLKKNLLLETHVIK